MFDDDEADQEPKIPELSQDVQALINNGLEFLDKAREELEASKPKFSVVSFWTAVEILLKVPLVHEHWTLVCSGKKLSEVSISQAIFSLSLTMKPVPVSGTSSRNPCPKKQWPFSIKSGSTATGWFISIIHHSVTMNRIRSKENRQMPGLPSTVSCGMNGSPSLALKTATAGSWRTVKPGCSGEMSSMLPFGSGRLKRNLMRWPNQVSR